MEITTGSHVKYSHPESYDEAQLVMLVIEDNGGRVIIQHTLPGWTIQPTEVCVKSELVLL